jgi:hypothetical protein
MYLHLYLFVVKLNLSYLKPDLLKYKEVDTMVPTDMQWNTLLQRHATVTVHLGDRTVTGDLYNITNEQIILLVPGKEGLFEVINRSEITDITW